MVIKLLFILIMQKKILHKQILLPRIKSKLLDALDSRKAFLIEKSSQKNKFYTTQLKINEAWQIQ